MNKNCQYAGDSYCLCSACQSVRKAIEEAKKVTPNEVEEIFREAEKMIETCGIAQEAEIGRIKGK